MDRAAMIDRLFRRREVMEGKPLPRTLSGRCWLFTGCKQSGDEYGKLSIDGQKVYAHRLAAHLWLNMPLDSPRVVRHRCTISKACFQPLHLTVGTVAENNGDLVAQGKHSNGKLCDRDVIFLIWAVRRGRITIGKWAAVNKVAYSTAYAAYNGILHAEVAAATHLKCDAKLGVGLNPIGRQYNAYDMPDIIVVSGAIDCDECKYAEEQALVDLPF